MIESHPHDFSINRWEKRRFRLTINFLMRFVSTKETILDLGAINGLGEYMKSLGFNVINTEDADLNFRQFFLKGIKSDVVTSFEVFEHLLNPFDVLRYLPCNKLVASVPLRLWFASAFWNKTNPLGKHYHEFEIKQFNYLLEKAGWLIIASETHTSPSFKLGFRTILRWITPRYYFVYAVRK
jgi:hypothetical protein